MIKKHKTLPVSPNLRGDHQAESSLYRLVFSRKGPLAYIAHLDMLRMFERAVMRSGIRCRYSQGFNPRPSIVFALPLGVGVETMDDCIDIEIEGRPSPAGVAERLNRVLPDGIAVLGAAVVPAPSRSIMALIRSAEYLFLFPGIGKLCDPILSAAELWAEKLSDGKPRTVNIRNLILDLSAPDADSLRARVKAGSRENLRPDLFLRSAVGLCGFTAMDALDTQILRTGIYADFGDGTPVRPIEQPGAERF